MHQKINEIDKNTLLDSKNTKIFWEDEKKEEFNELNASRFSVVVGALLWSVLGFFIAGVFSLSGGAIVLITAIALGFGVYRGFMFRSRFITSYFDRNSPIYGYTEGEKIFIGKVGSRLLESVAQKGADNFFDDYKAHREETRRKKIAEEKEQRSRQIAIFDVVNSVGFGSPLEGGEKNTFLLHWTKGETTELKGFGIVISGTTYTQKDIKKITYDQKEIVDQSASSTLVGFKTKGNQIANTLLKNSDMGDWGLSGSDTQAIYENRVEKGRDVYNIMIELNGGEIIAGKTSFKYEGNDTSEANLELRKIVFLLWNEIVIRDYEKSISDSLADTIHIKNKFKIIEREEEDIRRSLREDAGAYATTRFRKLGVLEKLKNTLVD